MTFFALYAYNSSKSTVRADGRVVAQTGGQRPQGAGLRASLPSGKFKKVNIYGCKNQGELYFLLYPP